MNSTLITSWTQAHTWIRGGQITDVYLYFVSVIPNTNKNKSPFTYGCTVLISQRTVWTPMNDRILHFQTLWTCSLHVSNEDGQSDGHYSLTALDTLNLRDEMQKKKSSICLMRVIFTILHMIYFSNNLQPYRNYNLQQLKVANTLF